MTPGSDVRGGLVLFNLINRNTVKFLEPSMLSEGAVRDTRARAWLVLSVIQSERLRPTVPLLTRDCSYPNRLVTLLQQNSPHLREAMEAI